ncbi:unnamed protein product, partial [Chrysoparadoxa australica]
RYYRVERGAPPTMKVHGYGIMQEKLALEPEFLAKLEHAVERSGQTGEFHFMTENLKFFPMGLFREEVAAALKDIRLDLNFLGAEPIEWTYTWEDLDKVVHISSFTNLLVLSLRKCQISVLHDSIKDLINLEELYLEKNSLQYLPSTFTHLKQLRVSFS